MTKVITEQELSNFVKNMVQGRGDLCIAVAFWGKDAIPRLGLDKATGGRILCNPQLGYCDRGVIEELQKTFVVFAHPRLHAKLYMTAERATVGSSNASSKGLGQEVEETIPLRELNLAIADQVTLTRLHDWFEERWKERTKISAEMFRRGLARPFVLPESGSLIKALRDSPDYFRERSLYLIMYS
jgi:hypothetical protein